MSMMEKMERRKERKSRKRCLLLYEQTIILRKGSSIKILCCASHCLIAAHGHSLTIKRYTHGEVTD